MPSYFLVKSEPYKYPFANLLEDKRTSWDGVRNFEARNHLRAMKIGDLLLFYHSNEGKEVVGIAEIVREHYPDPTDESGKFVCVDIAAKKPLKKPVTLVAVKSEAKLADMELLRLSRLSVQAVTPQQWAIVCKMGGI